VAAPVLVVAAALIRDDGRVLAARRIAPAGKWEFPGGKCEPGEEPLAALQRELGEELGIHARIHKEVVHPDGVWPIDQRLVMRIWYATPAGDPRPRGDHAEVTWLDPADLPGLDWLAADVPIAARIAAELRNGRDPVSGRPGPRAAAAGQRRRSAGSH
jgi:8-oxo-dGTP diphosphatase